MNGWMDKHLHSYKSIFKYIYIQNNNLCMYVCIQSCLGPTLEQLAFGEQVEVLSALKFFQIAYEEVVVRFVQS